MSVTVYFANISKRRNSTLQGTFSTSYDCVLKAPTSLDRPTFLVSAASMDYNAAKMGDRYYFIDDVVSVRDGHWEVSCVLDVLATYKADILASTQYVCYSASVTPDLWLADTRIAVKQNATIDRKTQTIAPAFDDIGFYVLSVVGQQGTDVYCVDGTDLSQLIDQISAWGSGLMTDIFSGVAGGTTYTWNATDLDVNFESLGKMLTQSGVLGNAYANAPNCIRSCIWVPFNKSDFAVGFPQNIFLGAYNTTKLAPKCNTSPLKRTFNVDIPWANTGWRRAVCEEVYLYLPIVGVVQLSADSLVSVNSLKVEFTQSAIDGTVSYCVSAGNEIIGIYGGSCKADYSIGINQQASAGDVINTALAGAERTAAAASDSTLSPVSMVSTIAETALEGVRAIVDVRSMQRTTHMTCIGSYTGAVNSKFSKDIECYTVSHDTVVSSSDMAATMGYPVMKPLALANLTGFCQCANAHVAASAQAREIDAIDGYINSGFFIE